jgi:hypothetical protein
VSRTQLRQIREAYIRDGLSPAQIAARFRTTPQAVGALRRRDRAAGYCWDQHRAYVGALRDYVATTLLRAARA